MKFENIRNLREDNDKTQKEVAAYLNIKQTTYSKYELGKINVPIDVFIKLADYYTVSIDYLVGRGKNKECALYAAVRILSGAFFIYWENTFLIYKKISEYLANIEFVRYSEIKFDAAGRTRTGTATNRLILSQVRLPIPPQRLILSDKKIFLSESAFLCYHIRSHFSTIFYDFICFLFAKFLSNLKTIKCCKIVFRCLCTANHLYTSIFFQEQLC